MEDVVNKHIFKHEFSEVIEISQLFLFLGKNFDFVYL